MLNRTVYNIILLLIFAFGYELIHINYNGNEYMYLNSLCAGGILLSHIYVKDYVEGKSKFIEILPLPIALLTSCILFFSYILSVQNPTGHQIFLGFVIWLMYLVDLGIMDSLVGRNLEKNTFLICLEKICLCLIALCAIQINGLSWFKIILLFIAFLYSLGVFIDQMEKIPLRNNKILHSLIVLIDIYLVYLSVKMVLSTPDDHYRIVLFVILLLSLVVEFNKAKVTDSQQALAAENTNEEARTSEIEENISNNDEDDDEDEEEDDFDAENATLKDIIYQSVPLAQKFQQVITKNLNSIKKSLQYPNVDEDDLEKIIDELYELRDDNIDHTNDLSETINDYLDNSDMYADEISKKELLEIVDILIEIRKNGLEKIDKDISKTISICKQFISKKKEIKKSQLLEKNRNKIQHEKKSIIENESEQKNSSPKGKENTDDKKEQDEYIGRFIDLE